MSQPALYRRTVSEQVEPTRSSSTSSRSTSGSSTTTVRTLTVFDKETRVSLAMEDLKRMHEDAFDRSMPRSIAVAVLRDLRSGTPAGYYRYAIEETLLAPRPSWRYTLAIVARLKRTKADLTDSYD